MKKNYNFKDLTGTVCAVSLACLPFVSINNTNPIKNKKPLVLETKPFFYNENMSNPSLSFKNNNIYMQQPATKLEKEAIELFGFMRDATSSERNSIKRYIDNISNDTGFNFYDLC